MSNPLNPQLVVSMLPAETFEMRKPLLTPVSGKAQTEGQAILKIYELLVYGNIYHRIIYSHVIHT